MKSKGLFLGILGMTTILTPTQANFIKNGYVGISVGYARHKIDPKTSEGVSIAGLHPVRRFNGVPAGLHFGGEIFRNNDMFAAAELLGDFIAASKQATSYSTGRTLRYKAESGFSGEFALKLGFTSWGFTPYARVGVIGTHWTQRATLSSPTLNTSAKKRMFKVGVAPGAGAIYKLNKNWATGVEYKYAMYKKHKLRLGSEHIRIEPRSHDVRLRLSYSF
jgi:opacity protein-like surface antigen